MTILASGDREFCLIVRLLIAILSHYVTASSIARERTLQWSVPVPGGSRPPAWCVKQSPRDPVGLQSLASLTCAKAKGATLRRDLIHVAARIARHGRGHITVHLPAGWHREHEWMNLFEATCGPPHAQAA